MNLESVLKYTIYVGVFALLFIPLIVADSMFFPYITGKGFTFRIIVEIIFGVWVVLALYRPAYRPRFSWILAALGAFVLWTLISSLAGVNTADSIWSNFERMEGWITLIHLLGLFLVVGSTFRSEDVWRWLFVVSSVVAVTVAIMGIAEVGEDVGRVDATLGNPIYLAGYLLVHIFLVSWLVLERVRNKVDNTRAKFKDIALSPWLYVGVVAIVLYLLGIWHSGTRGTIVGLGAGAFVSAVLVAWLAKARPRWRMVAGAGVLLVTLLAGGVFLARNTQVVQDTPVLQRFSRISLEEGTGGARLDLWGMALAGTADRPVLGWGVGNYSYVFSEHYNPDMYDDEEWFDRAHNVFMEWLVTTGVPGLLLYVSLFAVLIYYIWRDPRKGASWWSRLKWWESDYEPAFFTELNVLDKSILTGLVVAYAVHNFFVFDNIVSYILFILLLALFHARSARDFSLEALYQPVHMKIQQLVAIFLVIGVAVSVYFVNITGIQQSQGLIEALQTARANPPAALDEFEEVIPLSPIGKQEAIERLALVTPQALGGNLSSQQRTMYISTTTEHLQEFIDAHGPGAVRPRVFMGTFLTQISNYPQIDRHQEAIEYFEEAHEINPQKQSVLLYLAQAHRGAGNTGQALEYAGQAYELTPPTDESTLTYAVDLIRAGEVERGQELLVGRFGTSTLYNTDLIRAYEAAEAYEPMIAILERHRQENIDDPQAWVSLSVAYQNAGRETDAVALIEEAIEEFPQHADDLRTVIGRLRAGE